MQIAIQIIILGYFIYQDALETKNKKFSKSKMAAILPKYGKNSENDANNHSDDHFRPFYAPECLGISKLEIFKIQDGCHMA